MDRSRPRVIETMGEGTASKNVPIPDFYLLRMPGRGDIPRLVAESGLELAPNP